MLRSARNYDRKAASLETAITCDPDTDMAQQQFKEDCDINTIVRRYGLTGKVPANLRMPLPDEFHDITDFHTAANLMREAQEQFMTVPAAIRKRFANDPGELMAFLADENNRDEALKLGLLQPPPEVDRTGEAAPPAPPAT